MPAGERSLARLAMLHRVELESLQGTFRVARITAFNDDGANGAEAGRCCGPMALVTARYESVFSVTPVQRPRP